MSISSMIVDHSLNSQESPSGRPELQRQRDRLKLLLDLTNTLVSTLECRDVLRTVAASIRQLMHCDFVGVWLPDVEHVYLRQLAIDFPESKGFVKEDALQPIVGSAIGRAFKGGKPVVVDVISELRDLHEVTVVGTPESGCALPLINQGRTLGVLTLGSRVENSINPQDVDFLMRAAGQLAIAIENRLAYRDAELKDRLAQEKLYLEEEIRGEMDFGGIVGQSSALRHVLNLVETVAPSDSTVLLLGETGTGRN
jgi:formate hydrogenlyase transcriptional activator